MQKYQELENELLQSLEYLRPKKEGDYIIFDLNEDENNLDKNILKVLNILAPTNQANRKAKIDLQECSLFEAEKSFMKIFGEYCLFNGVKITEAKDKMLDYQVDKGFLLECRKICLKFAGSYIAMMSK